MTPSRLDTIAPDLTRAIQTQPGPILKAISVTVAEWVVRELQLTDPRIVRGVEALHGEEDSPPSVRDDIKGLVDELDERAWDIQDLIDSGEATERQYEAAFDQARAAMALWYALDEDLLSGALECAYEAQAARGPDPIRRIVYAIVESPR